MDAKKCWLCHTPIFPAEEITPYTIPMTNITLVAHTRCAEDYAKSRLHEGPLATGWYLGQKLKRPKN